MRFETNDPMPRRFRAFRLLGLAALLAAASAGCSSSSSPTNPLAEGGQFTATVTGAVDAQLTGTASSLGTGASPAAWVLEMPASDGSGGLSFSAEGRARPTPGSYTVDSALEHGGNAPGGAFTAVVGVTSPLSSFGSLSGTLTITASSATRVSGEFTFIAADPDDESRTVTVNGEFTAANQDF